MKQKTGLEERINIVVAGEAGQGVNTIEDIVVSVLKKSSFHVYATKEYMSRVRGGINTTTISVSSRPVGSYSSRIDVLVPLVEGAVSHVGARYSDETIVIGEADIPFARIAADIGNALFAGTVVAGVICGMLRADEKVLVAEVRRRFGSKGDDIVGKNLTAANTGYARGAGIAEKKASALLERRTVSPDRSDTKPGDRLLLNGADAIAIGALAGGCNAVFAYPMTPSTGVFTALAGYSKERDIVVEQVEDEIGVINMAVGAWYAGARSLVSTSGGGFALMTEGLSLAGMTETPLVVHLAQRPGPATGLPTRTEQGDLNLAVYAGHGFFPRIVLAPSNTCDGFELAQRAFNLADKHQVPVIILTDQYFVDTYYDIEDIDPGRLVNEYAVVETGENYRRYEVAKNGVSPRGVPGFGKGLVCADSDEHDEDGRITEDLDGVREEMTAKRFRKAGALLSDAVPPAYTGRTNAGTLIVGWGSTYETIRDALMTMGMESVAHLHFSQVFPIPPQAREYLDKADRVIVIENNETGQFADLLSLETGTRIPDRILKSNGMPFSVEELVTRIGDVIGKTEG